MKKILKIILCCVFALLLIGCGEKETGPNMDKVNEVISEIDNLPAKATANDEEDVNFVLAMYEDLSAEEKALVTNKEKLDEAINCIDYYKNEATHVEKIVLDAKRYLESTIPDVIDYKTSKIERRKSN